MSSFKISALAIAAGIVASCTGIGSALDTKAITPSANPVTVDSAARNNKRARLAQAQHPKILKTYGGEYSDTKLERMVAGIVGRLTTVSDNPNEIYRITILDSANINAFALPGGYLYVTRGLLALANDSAELAAVIAHEMAHVTSNHGLLRQRKEKEEGLAARVSKELLNDNPDAKAAIIRGKLRLAQFSRNQELEADIKGIKATGDAGYDPLAAARFLKSMNAYTKFRSVSGAKDPTLDFLATHPTGDRRINLALRHARNYSGNSAKKRDRNAFLNGIDGMLYGDHLDEGVIRRSTFIHPKLGIRFTVPDNFVIENGKDAVTAAGPNDIAVRFDVVNVKRSIPLTNYIASGWVTGLDASSVKPIKVNGLEGANAKAQADGWRFDITVFRFKNDVYRLLTAAPLDSTRLETIASNLRNSLRKLSQSDKSLLSPLRVRVLTVKPGQSVNDLAAQMVGTSRKLSLFKLLNGLGPGATLQVGSRVKIITDK